jgi:hypothetical protein
MARLSRLVIPGLPHHVTQRGNGRTPVFFGGDDYKGIPGTRYFKGIPGTRYLNSGDTILN